MSQSNNDDRTRAESRRIYEELYLSPWSEKENRKALTERRRQGGGLDPRPLHLRGDRRRQNCAGRRHDDRPLSGFGYKYS